MYVYQSLCRTSQDTCFMAQGKKNIVDINVDDVEKRRSPTKHYVYVIMVTWSDGNVSVIYRRYSKFFDFQVKLLDSFPRDAGKNDPAQRIIPFLPGKIIFGRSHIREVAVKRQEPINIYCKQLIGLPPLISECQLVLDFFEPSVEDLVPDNVRNKKNEAVEGKSISDPVVLEQYLVISNYSRDGANEISLQAGEIVDVIEKNETGWWFVSGEDGQGWVPSSYLERPGMEEDKRTISSTADQAYPHLSTKEYVPQFADELPLHKGTVVEVLEKNLDGWWLVRSKGKEGRVPGNCLTRTDTARAKRILQALPQTAVDIVQNLSSVSNLKGPYPPQPEDRQKSDIGRRHQMPLPNKSASGSKLQPPVPPAAASKPNASPNLSHKPPPPRRNTIKKMVPSDMMLTEEPIYMTSADFVNHAGDGISFKQGEHVEVLDKHTSGWWYVKINKKQGWAPQSYIQKTMASCDKQLSSPAQARPELRKNPAQPDSSLKTAIAFKNDLAKQILWKQRGADQVSTSQRPGENPKLLPKLPNQHQARVREPAHLPNQHQERGREQAQLPNQHQERSHEPAQLPNQPQAKRFVVIQQEDEHDEPLYSNETSENEKTLQLNENQPPPLPAKTGPPPLPSKTGRPAIVTKKPLSAENRSNAQRSYHPKPVWPTNKPASGSKANHKNGCLASELTASLSGEQGISNHLNRNDVGRSRAHVKEPVPQARPAAMPQAHSHNGSSGVQKMKKMFEG